jgi:hypothetical protein
MCIIICGDRSFHLFKLMWTRCIMHPICLWWGPAFRLTGPGVGGGGGRGLLQTDPARFCLCILAIKYFILLLQFGIWVSGPRQTDRRDLGFKTSTDGHTESGFQDLDKQTDGIWVSEPQQMDSRDLGFRTLTNGQSGSGFQDLDRWTDGIWVSGPGQTDEDSSHRRGRHGIWVSGPGHTDGDSSHGRGRPLLHRPLPSPTPQNVRHR